MNPFFHVSPVLAALLLLTVAFPIHAAERVPIVSALSLVGNPQPFTGKRVCVSGWLYVEQSDHPHPRMYLFPTPDHLRFYDFPSSIIVDPVTFATAFKKAAPKSRLARAHGAYVLFYGRLAASDLTQPGNLGVGALLDITEISQVMFPPSKSK